MNRFDYLRPTSLAEALAAGAQPGSAYMGGGTNLLDLMKIGVQRPERIVDIGALPGLDGIEWREDGSVRIGALVAEQIELYGAITGSVPAIPAQEAGPLADVVELPRRDGERRRQG